MVSLKGTQTEKNLLTAFAGESQARNRYTYFASQAKKEGYVQIQAIFQKTANQEKAHAKRLFTFLECKTEETVGAFPAVAIGSTAENLAEAAVGELYEYSKMYPSFAKTAEQEGFSEIATVFKSIAVAEMLHEKQYNALDANIKAGKVFKKDGPATWTCRNCGYVQKGDAAPEICPACAHTQAHFELLKENF
ncbi:MAG: rubrerythrin family protein [Desulfobacteraceae bacterium]|nr:rubrerythrin family protein [Desulfobacteraceae bacterium]